MSWQTCIACRAGIWSHLPTLWPGWLGADWRYLACFGNQFLSATHLYPKTIVAWFRVVSCLVEKHVSAGFFGPVCWVFRTGRDAGGTGCRAHVPGLVCPTILRHFESVAEYFSQLNLLQIKLMTRRLQCSESRGRMSWKRPACLMPVLYESSMLYSLQSLHGQAIKVIAEVDKASWKLWQLWHLESGSTWQISQKTWDLTSHPKCQSLELYVEMVNL